MPVTATTAEPRMERRRSIGIAPPAATRDPWSLALRSSPMRGVGASMYDTVSEGSPGVPTTWDLVLKGDSMRHKTTREQFNALDRNGDGYIDVHEVSAMLGNRGADASKLISSVDRQGTGKLDYDTFSRMLRHSVIPSAGRASSSASSTPGSTPPTASSSLMDRWRPGNDMAEFIDFN